MPRGRSRYWLQTASAGALCLALCGAALAQQEKHYSFNLPQQPLSDSLKAYARVSGLQIIFTEDLVQGYVGKPLHGELSAAEALDRLLNGTGLFVEHTSTGAVMIRREQHAEVQPAPVEKPLPLPPPKRVALIPAEQVIVTGLIYSLQANLDTKRNAPGLIDVISSEDIGKFPDVDLADAMQRIPGVTISRGVSSLGGVPTSIGTATEITVRGFGPSFNETLFNRRQIASGAGRAFDFSSIGADFVSMIEVMKSPDATLSSGAIGATVNIRFPEPFDYPGLHVVGSASATASPEQGNITPSAKLLLSDTLVGDTLGILVDGAYSLSRTRGNHVNIQGWEGTHIADSQLAGASAGASSVDTIPAWYIQDYGLYQETTTDARINGRAVLQWKPLPDLRITLDDNFSRDALHAIQHGFSVWFNSGSLHNIVQDQHGTITSFVQPNSPTDFQGQINGSVLQNNDTGLNLKWQAAEHLEVVLDYDNSQGWLNPARNLSTIDADVGYGPSTTGGLSGSNLGIIVPGDHALPYPTGYGPNGNAAAFLDPSLIGSHVLPISAVQRFDRVQQVRAEAVWTQPGRLRVAAGYQYIGDHDNAQTQNDFANNQWQAYAGYGPASGNVGTHGVSLPASLFSRTSSIANFINGFDGSANLPPQLLAFNPYAVLNYLQSLGNPQTSVIPGFNVGCCDPSFDGTYRLANVAAAASQVIENSAALYTSLLAKFDLAGLPLQVNAGLRGVSTSLTTIGLGQVPQSLTVQPSDHTAFLVNFGPVSTMTKNRRRQFFLPNLDLTLEATDDLQLRFDVSRTLTRPLLDEITPVLNISPVERVGALVASGGNPDLMPYMSVNLDLSAGWYYQANSYLSVDAFNKHVTDFIVQSSAQQTINGVIDPTTGQPALFTVSSYVNGPNANVYGAEIAWQHVFGDTGYGFQINGTLVGTNRPYDPGNLSISGFAVTGLADSANLVAFYDKNGFQLRVAANWRDRYLDHFGQAQNNSAFGTEPTFVNASTQIDFTAAYAVSPQINIYFEGLNLNDATFSTHGRYSDQLLDAVDYGRRFTVGVHFKY